MAQRSRVPKFGNWDSDNIPYTAHFDNARKGKAGVKMNPNDPEENPEAFMFGRMGDGIDSVFHDVPAQRNTSDLHKIVTPTSMTLESASGKSNSNKSLVLPNHHHMRSNCKKSMTEGNDSLYPPSLGPNRLRREINASDDISHKSVSIPKFGAWDEKDPTSGEGFTVIFSKVKEEKQIAAANLPLPPQPSNHSKSRKKETRSKRCCCLF